MRTFADRLRDIATTIERIKLETAHGRAVFEADPKIQVWMLYHIQLIGEAVRAVSVENSLHGGHPRVVEANHAGCWKRS